jgi:hypothetical protein
MIKKWSDFNESKVYGSLIQSRITLLEDLSIDLSDIGLRIEIWNGSWKDDGGTFGLEHGKKNYRDFIYGENPPSKSIIMLIEDYDSILDLNNYYGSKLVDKEEIIELEKSLKSYGIPPRKKIGFGDKVYFFFDKNGK